MSDMDYSLLNAFAEMGGSTETADTDTEPDTDDVVQQDVQEPAPVEEIGQGIEPKTSTESVEPDTEQEPAEPDQDTNQEQVPALLARIEELTKLVQQGRTVQPEKDDDKDDGEGSGTAPEAIDFLTGIDMDEVLASPENFNGLLNKVHQAGMEKASSMAAEKIMRNLPRVLSTYIRNHIAMNEAVKLFYEENPDLRAHGSTVGMVANEIANENPQLSQQKVFDQAATRVRTMLKLKAPVKEQKGGENVTQQNTSTRRNPGFVGQRGRRTASRSPLQGMAKDIEELIALQ